MSGDALTAEEKTRYDAARKELMQALTKRRTADKQLVRFLSYGHGYGSRSYIKQTLRRLLRSTSTNLRANILLRPLRTAGAISFMDLRATSRMPLEAGGNMR